MLRFTSLTLRSMYCNIGKQLYSHSVLQCDGPTSKLGVSVLLMLPRRLHSFRTRLTKHSIHVLHKDEQA